MEAELAPYRGEVEVETLFAEGEAASVIARLAIDQAADIIVMGTHARTGLIRALMSSVAERTVRLAAVPVLIVR